MRVHHAMLLLLLLIVGYMIGVKFPGPGQSLLGGVGM